MSGLFPLHFPLSLFYPAINVKLYAANEFELKHLTIDTNGKQVQADVKGLAKLLQAPPIYQ